MRMSGKLILSNRTVNIKDTMKPCLCHEGVTVCVGHQDKLKQIADRWNSHDQLTNENARLREENAKLKELAIYCSGFLGCEDTRDSMALHSITIMAKELLNKDTK